MSYRNCFNPGFVECVRYYVVSLLPIPKHLESTQLFRKLHRNLKSQFRAGVYTANAVSVMQHVTEAKNKLKTIGMLLTTFILSKIKKYQIVLKGITYYTLITDLAKVFTLIQLSFV